MQNRGLSKVMLPPGALGETPSLLLFGFPWLRASLGLWLQHSNSCLCLHVAFSSVSMFSLLLSLTGHLCWIEIGPTQII